MVEEKLYPWRDALEPNKRVCVSWTPPGSRVLEFGCAAGYVSRVLRDERRCRVTGFEYSPAMAQQAEPFCERVVVGDIEDFSLWERLTPPYDVAMFGDVLEHLRDPEAVLRRCRDVLQPDGRLIVSIPNIAHYTVRLALLFGRFDYTQYGILDSTHLHFYTRKSLLEMLARTGYTVEHLEFSRMRTRSDHIFGRLGLTPLKRLLNRAGDALFPNAAAFQWLTCCRLAAAAPRSAPVAREGAPA